MIKYKHTARFDPVFILTSYITKGTIAIPKFWIEVKTPKAIPFSHIYLINLQDFYLILNRQHMAIQLIRRMSMKVLG